MCGRNEMRPSNAFFETLGQYVYMYRGTTDRPAYVGKGVGDRCLHHLKDKGYKIEDCMIVAKNLERFNLDKKDASFVLESYLIATLNPEDNSVSGHYKECFIMADLSFLFGEYVDSQRDMFAELNALVNENLDVFKGTMGYTETRGTSFYIETGMRENVYFGIKVQTKEPQITCILKANNEKFFKSLVEKCEAGLSQYELDSTSNKNVVSFPVETLVEAVDLWASFTK
jgi:hypothetical protein